MASGVALTALFSSDILLRLDDAAWDSSVASVEAIMVQAVTQQGNSRLSNMMNEHLGAGSKRLCAQLALAAARVLGISGQTSALWATS